MRDVPMELLFSEFEQGDPSELRVAGEIDVSTAGQLRAALEDAVARDKKTVVDMTGVTFCDATGLRVVLQTAASLNGSGPLRLRNASRVAMMLELVGLDDVSPIEILEPVP